MADLDPIFVITTSFFSLTKTDDPFSITEERSIELIINKRNKDQERLIKEFNDEPGLLILKGRFGAYISWDKKNYRIPKGKDAEMLTLEECKDIIKNAAIKPAIKRKK